MLILLLWLINVNHIPQRQTYVCSIFMPHCKESFFVRPSEVSCSVKFLIQGRFETFKANIAESWAGVAGAEPSPCPFRARLGGGEVLLFATCLRLVLWVLRVLDGAICFRASGLCLESSAASVTTYCATWSGRSEKSMGFDWVDLLECLWSKGLQQVISSLGLWLC